MPSLAKKRRSSPFHRGNIFAALVVLGVVGLFFFLPELVPVKQSANAPAGKDQEAKLTDQASPNETPQESIDSILFPREIVEVSESEIESAQQELPSQRADVDQDGPVPVKMELNEPAQPAQISGTQAAGAPCEPAVTSPKDSDELIPAGVPLTWDILLTSKRKKILATARRDVTKLYRELPKQATNTKFEVLAFIKALDTVLAGSGNGLVEPNAVLDYLNYANKRVSQAMYRDILDRRYALTWNEVSLGSVLESSQAAQARERALRPYNPNITATDFRVSQSVTSTAAVNTSAPAYFSIRGYLLGEDTIRLSVYIGQYGIKRSVRLGKSDSTLGTRDWQISGVLENPKDVIIVEAEDKAGEKIRKLYRLTPGIYRFKRERLKGNDIYTSTYGRPNPRIDNYLRVEGGLQRATASTGKFQSVRDAGSSTEQRNYSTF
ncbi:MAG: hypothetical protein KDD64_06420 [Bdellovibrionales bacterium]|nr:hypothetical protein [Bdellovibrionales bacterium]